MSEIYCFPLVDQSKKQGFESDVYLKRGIQRDTLFDQNPSTVVITYISKYRITTIDYGFEIVSICKVNLGS